MGNVHILAMETLERSLKDPSSDPLDLCHDSGFTRAYEREDEEMTQRVFASYLHKERAGDDDHILHLDVLTIAPMEFYAAYPDGKKEIIKHRIPTERFLLDIRYKERELFGQEARLVCFKNLPIDPKVNLYDAFELQFDSSGTLSRVQVQSNSPRHTYASSDYDSLVKKGSGQVRKYHHARDMAQVIKGVCSSDLCSRTLDAQATIFGLLQAVKEGEQIVLERALRFDK